MENDVRADGHAVAVVDDVTAFCGTSSMYCVRRLTQNYHILLGYSCEGGNCGLMIVGGTSQGPLTRVDIFDPALGTVCRGNDLPVHRSAHTAGRSGSQYQVRLLCFRCDG